MTKTLLKWTLKENKMKHVYHKGELIPADEWDFENYCRKPKKVSKKAPSKVEAETQPEVDFHQD